MHRRPHADARANIDACAHIDACFKAHGNAIAGHAEALRGVRGIVDPANLGWPRQVEGLNGVVSIPAKPQRIITASIGHDEMILALVPIERLVGVGAVSKDPTYSNVARMLESRAEVSREPETIIALSPDVVVTSPYYPGGGNCRLVPSGHPGCAD